MARLRGVNRDVFESEAVEEPLGEDERVPETPAPLPETSRSGQIIPFAPEVRTMALAAAGGVVAGAVTVAAMKAIRADKPRSRGRRNKQPVLASRSFLIDIHLLGK